MSYKAERLRKANRKNTDQLIGRFFSDFKYRLILEGIGVGIVVGVIISTFRLILSKLDVLRNAIIEGAKEKLFMAIVALLILVFCLVLVGLVQKYEPHSAGSGIPFVKAELENKAKEKWFSVLVTKFFGSIFAIFAGLSLGHEGPSIQLGAMIGKGFSRITGRLSDEEKYLIICGAGAGIATAFNAPLAGVIFVLEEFRRKFSHKALLSTMAASVVADWIASTVFGLDPVFDINLGDVTIPILQYWPIIVLGLILGLFGWLHNRCLILSQKIFGKLPQATKGVIEMVVIVIVAIFYPIILGSGHGLVGLASDFNISLKALIVLLVLKFVFSMFSSGFGAPGGILLPLLVVGALTGALFSRTFLPLVGYEIYLSHFIIFGMAGYFAAIVRTPITGIILITEMTGALTNLLPLSMVTLVSYLTAELLGAKPVYEMLYEKMFGAGIRVNSPRIKERQK